MSGDDQERTTFSIGEVARRFGVEVSTLRWWEKQGLLVPSCRESGRRRYDTADVRRVALIQLLQETTLMSLDEIRTVMSDGRSGEWRDTVQARLAVCEEQLVRLRAAKAYLTHALRCRRDDPVDDCPRLAEEIDGWLESADGRSGDRAQRARHRSRRRSEALVRREAR